MKKLLFNFSLLSLISANSFSQSVFWDSPITVALGSTYSNVYPRLNLISGDVPLITWSKFSGGSIYSSYLSGSSFSTPLQVNPAGVTPVVYTWCGPETSTSGDTVIIVYNADVAGLMKIFTVRSIDGGITFQDTVRADNFVGNDMAMFPSIGMGLNGNPVVSFMRMDSIMNYPEWHTARSIDGGASFLPDVSVSNLNPANVCDCCPSTVVTSGNTHVTMYRNNESSERTIYAGFSTDESATYPIQTQVDLTNWTIAACPSTGPSGVIVGDTLIYAWRSLNTSRIYISTLNINDQQIGVQRLLTASSSSTQNYPVIAAKGDTIGIVWQENASGANDVYFSFSTIGVAGLGINVDTISSSMSSTQTRPDIAFNNKKFHICFSDVVGNDIVYMSGNLSGVGIDSKESETELKIISVSSTGYKSDLLIQSPLSQEANINITNASGQCEGTVQVQLSQGTNKYSIPAIKSEGLKTITLTTKRGQRTGMKYIPIK